MRYYAKYDDSGRINCFGIGLDGAEITEEEYRTLKDRTDRMWKNIENVVSREIDIESVDEDIREDVRRESIEQFAHRIYSGTAINTIPESLHVEVQTKVDELIAVFGPFDSDEISDSEALDIILGGETA